LVNPKLQQIGLVDLPITGGDNDAQMRAFKDAIGVEELGFVTIGHKVQVVCDDDGRLRDGQSCCQFGGKDGLLMAGTFLICGLDPEGNSVDVPVTVDMTKDRIEWLPDTIDYTPPPPVVMSFETLDELIEAINPKTEGP
jgi:hypothetical protein